MDAGVEASWLHLWITVQMQEGLCPCVSRSQRWQNQSCCPFRRVGGKMELHGAVTRIMNNMPSQDWLPPVPTQAIHPRVEQVAQEEVSPMQTPCFLGAGNLKIA